MRISNFYVRYFIITLALLPFILSFSRLSYLMQPGTPIVVPNFVNPVAACNWLGVSGQVFDRTGLPVQDLLVVVGGTLEGSPISKQVLSGSSNHLGLGGFEITLADHVVASQDELFLQLFDATGTPLSGRVVFDTYASCDQNQVLINFKEMTSLYENILPLILISR